jgi:hypothetical protein
MTPGIMEPGMAAPDMNRIITGAMPPSPIERRLDRLEGAVARLEKAAGLAASVGAANAVMEPPRAMTVATNGRMEGPWAVHLASYRAMGQAQAGWETMKKKFPQLDTLSILTSEFDPGNGRGTYVRLMARGFPTKGEATAFCSSLKSAGQFCEAKGPLP